jgi:hypothetical protein
MPATGNKFSIRGVSVFRLTGDRLSSCVNYRDMAAFMKQLGFMPDAPAQR